MYCLFVSAILYKHNTKYCVCGVKHKFHKVLARYLSILYERQAIIKRQKTTVSPWDTVGFDTLFYPSDIVVFLFLPEFNYGLIPRRRNSSQAEIVYAKCGCLYYSMPEFPPHFSHSQRVELASTILLTGEAKICLTEREFDEIIHVQSPNSAVQT